MSGNTLENLYSRILDRRGAHPDESYTARLFESGLERIAQKVGEEGVEVALAAKNPNTQALIEEMADLWYHCLVLLAARELAPRDVYAELEKRGRPTGRNAANTDRHTQ